MRTWTFRIFSRPIDVGVGHDDLAVETAGAQQRGVEHVGPVGGGDEDDALVGLEAVHLDQQLVQGLLALVVAAAEAGAAMAADRVDLVDEDDAGRVLLGLFEHVADAAGADADEHFDEIRARDREEGHVGFAGDGAGEQGLAGAGRADQQDAPRNAAAEALELLRVLQELDDLLQVFLGLVDAGDVLEGHAAVGLGEQLGLGFAETHGLAAGALHLARQENPHADEGDQRQAVDQQGHQPVIAVGRRLGGDLDVFLVKAVHQRRVVRRIGRKGLAVGVMAGDFVARDGDVADMALIGLGEQLAEIDFLGRGALAGVLEQHHQRDHQKNDDHPQSEIAEIRIHLLSWEPLRSSVARLMSTICRLGQRACQVKRASIGQKTAKIARYAFARGGGAAPARRLAAQRQHAVRAEPCRASAERRAQSPAILARHPQIFRQGLEPLQPGRRLAGALREGQGQEALENRQRRVIDPGQVVDMWLRRRRAGEKIARRPFDRLIGLARPLGEGRRPDRGQAEALQCGGDGAPARPGEDRIGIGRIVEKILALAAAIIDQNLFAQAEQGADKAPAGKHLVARHSREAGKAAAAREPDQHRFPLVVGMVRHGHGLGAYRSGVVEQQGIAGGARLFLHAGRRLFAAPGEDGVIKAEIARPAADLERFGARFRPQPVIDGRGMERDAGPRIPPAPRETRQRQRIRPAGNRDQQAREAFETGEQPIRVESVRGQQEAFFASRSAASFSAGGALGYLRGISEKKAQACVLAPSALSDMPSLTMA